MNKKPVVVTTAHRGVFFGYIAESEDFRNKTVELSQARNCVSWTTDLRGFVGLATVGPSKGCRVGPAAETMTLHNVTSVTAATAEAAERWEEAPWSM